ncbi:hypothetical protein C5B97_14000 [Pseudoclavibacter sp. RFBB5]|nr:hypothetical protein C5B97_14000 [Pseudoclavibacter sp. RFBB5]
MPEPATARAPARTSGGVFSRAEWNGEGGTRRGLEASLKQGTFWRVSPGWFATPDASAAVVEAVRLHGRATCLTALSSQGVWTPPHSGVHVRIAASALGITRTTSSNPRTGEVVLHRASVHQARPLEKHAVDDIDLALECALLCLPERDLVVVADSALQLRLITRSSLTELAAPLAVSAREKLKFVDARSQSGTESIVRLWLQLRGVRVTPQFHVVGVGHVDLLVGDRLVIECDSKEFHSAEWHSRNDRRRDLVLNRLGYRVLRLTYEQVMFQWPRVEATLRALLAEGSHLRGSRRRPGA